MEEKTIQDLLRIGFIKVGYWELDQNSEIKFEIANEYLSTEHLLYAFECDERVKYIGITEVSLKNRMINYKNATEKKDTSGSTNKKVNKSIRDLLKLKKEVYIYILKNEAPCDYFGFSISLATGIEKSLISAFDDGNLWNSRGVKNTQTLDKKVKSNTGLKSNQIILKLGKEALKGWIIFKKEVDHLLPIESDDMDIFYKEEVIQGYFTRSEPNIKTNGKKRLKEIFNTDFTLDDKILITILNPNEVVLEKFPV